MAKTKEEKASYDRARYLANREKRIAQACEYQRRNKDRINERKRGNSKHLQRKRRNYQAVRDDVVARKYGLTAEQVEAMKIACGFRCQVCHRQRRLVIDHCHITGRVRGLLCQGCNTALGKLGDCAKGLRAALEYLQRAEQISPRSLLATA